MITKENKKAIRQKKHYRLRSRISGTAQQPRLSVFRSNKHIYAQIIDDDARRTIAAASTTEKDVQAQLEHTDDIAAASFIGDLVAKRALEKGVKEVVFDRGGYIYQGKIAALAESARQAGLEF